MRKIDADDLKAKFPTFRDFCARINAQPTAQLTEGDIERAARIIESMKTEINLWCMTMDNCMICKMYKNSDGHKECMVRDVTTMDILESYKKIFGINWVDRISDIK